MNDITFFLVGQSAIIVGAIVTAYVKLSVQVGVIGHKADDLGKDHEKLSGKVDSISRAVARLEGQREGERIRAFP